MNFIYFFDVSFRAHFRRANVEIILPVNVVIKKMGLKKPVNL